MNEILFCISLSIISFIGGMILGMSIISNISKIAIKKAQKQRLKEAINEADKDIDLLNEEQKEWARGCLYGLLQAYKMIFGVELEELEENKNDKGNSTDQCI